MPEGPEIRRAADKIAEVLEGQIIETVSFGLPRLRHYSRQLRGHRINNIETRGKALLTHFEHGYSIYSHNQLYGVWRVCQGHKLPKSSRSRRLLLQTAKHSAILYSASDISVWPTEELCSHPFLAKIGPDIMDPGLTWQAVVARLRARPFAGRTIAALYLDQSFLAGNGNYLRSEIIHGARLHPGARPADLSTGELGRLARSTLALSRRSYETGGVTLAPRLSATLMNKSTSRNRRRFYVFGRAGGTCYRCGGTVERHEIGNRRLYYCPGCQPH
jgi:endonuclease-8